MQTLCKPYANPMNYYNEHDPKAAAWLRELITQGLIPAGTVDERSITEIQPHELSEYTQCHFFAGIGGWSLALELAGWPATRPVWTGSCPCQPFSSAGKQLAQADERHLWPAFFNLIRECRPERVFGEQVASAIGKGWLDGVSADLESENYACGAAVLGAHSVGAPHLRQRLYWVADAGCSLRRAGLTVGRSDGKRNITETRRTEGAVETPFCSTNGWVADGGRLVLSSEPGLEGHAGDGYDGHQPGRIDAQQDRSTTEAGGAMLESVGDADCEFGAKRNKREKQSRLSTSHGTNDSRSSFWDDYSIVHCRDDKARRFEPGSFPLAHGLPGRVGLLRGYGNAIVPQTAAAFIEACQEVTA